MIKVVFDTNIIISGLIANSGPPYEVLEMWRQGNIVLLTSDAIIKEVVNVLKRPFFQDKRHIDKADISQIKRVLETDAIVFSPNTCLEIVGDDPDDNRVLECALDGDADYIISGDHHLLEIEEFQNIQIISARKFLIILKSQKNLKLS